MKILKLFLLGLIIILGGCDEESDLSEVVFDDPSAVRPEITISKNTTLNGATEEIITVWLYDNDNDPLKLKEGGVSVNDVEMALQYQTNLPYYKILSPSQLPITGSTTYNFNIRFGGGGNYPAIVDTPNELHTFNVPTTHSRTENMALTWLETDSNARGEIHVTHHYVDPDDNHREYERTYQIVSTGSGQYVLDADVFQNPAGIYRTELELIIKNDGIISEQFLEGGTIIAQYTIKKASTIID